MMPALNSAITGGSNVSPLVISDRLLSLAQDADRAGLRITAEHLLGLASDVLDPLALRRDTRMQMVMGTRAARRAG